MIKLQLALDTLDGDQAMHLAAQAAPYVDIIEAGTPLIKSVGIGIVTRLRAAHPDKLILADLKTSDVGAYEAGMGFRAGADIVTTQGITTMATIAEVQREADAWQRRAEVDMTGVREVVSRAIDVKRVGVSLVLYHRSIDEEVTQSAAWDDAACNTVRELCNLGIDISIAGGVNAKILSRLRGLPLYGIVVGRGITAQPDPGAASAEISHMLSTF